MSHSLREDNVCNVYNACMLASISKSLWKRSDILPATIYNSQDLSYLLIPFWWPSPCGPGYWQFWQCSTLVSELFVNEIQLLRSEVGKFRLLVERLETGCMECWWQNWVLDLFLSWEVTGMVQPLWWPVVLELLDAVGRHALQIGWRPSMAELTLDVADAGVSTLPWRCRA